MIDVKGSHNIKVYSKWYHLCTVVYVSCQLREAHQNLNYFITLKYKKIDQKLKFINNTFLHTGVDHSCREQPSLKMCHAFVCYLNEGEKRGFNDGTKTKSACGIFL